MGLSTQAQDLSFFKDSTQVVFKSRKWLSEPTEIIPQITTKKVIKEETIFNSLQPQPVYFEVKPNIIDKKEVMPPIKMDGIFIEQSLKYAKIINAPPLLYRDNSKRNIRYLDKAHGSFSNHISSITQDSLGIIWMGSSDSGLAKFNRKNFALIDKSVGLSSDTVEAVFMDSKKRLWVSTYSGLQYIRDNKLFTLKGNFNDYKFSTIYEDRNHDIWVSTFNKGVLKITNTQVYLYNSKTGLTAGGISGVYQDSKGNYWFGSWAKKGFTMYDGKHFYHYKPEEHKLGLDFHAFIEYEGKLWMGTYNGGLVVYDKGTFYRYDFFSEQRGNVYSFSINKNGLWFNIYGVGVGNYNSGKFQFYFKDDGLRGSEVYKIYSDKDDNIWVADLFNGFSRIDNDLFYKETFNNQFAPIQVTTIVKDPKGNTWFFPNGGLLTKEKDNILTTYVNESDYKTPPVNHSFGGYFLEENRGWLSTIFQGVAYYNNNTFTFYNFGKENTFGRIDRDKNGRMWFASDRSGAIYNSGGKFYKVGKKEGLFGDTINDLKCVDDGSVWLAVKNHGLSVLKYADIKTLNKENGLISNNILALLFDSKQRLWLVSESKGVQMIDGQTSYTFSEKNGLLSNKVKSVIESEPDVFWITSSIGLTKITFSEKKTLEINNFSNSFGNNLIGLNGSVISDGKGNVTWGSTRGLLKYNKHFENKKFKKPQLYLEDLVLNDNLVLNKIDKTNPLKLHPNDKLEITVNAIDWGFESSLKFEYHLENREGKLSIWKSLSASSKFELNNFKLTDSKIFIRALSYSGESNLLEIPLKIRPYFYQNIYYHFVFWILIIALTIMYFQYKKKNALKDKIILEKLINNKTIALQKEKKALEKSNLQISQQNKEKDVLIQEVHHRVKNNLQLISSLVSMQLASVKSSKAKIILTDTYNRIASMSLVHEILYSKKNMSFISLKTYLSDLITSINNMINLEKRNIIINNSLKDIDLDVSHCIALGMITNEAISNALKHAFKENQEDAEITISLSCDSKDKLIVFIIKDNGIGIKEKFLKGKNKSLGLRLIKIFSKQLKASLEIKNNYGTEIIVEFTCKNHENCGIKNGCYKTCDV